MAENNLRPGFVKIHYNRGTVQHVLTLPVKPVQSNPIVGLEPELECRNGQSRMMDELIDGLVTVLVPFFHTSVEIALAEFWKWQPEPADPVFVYAYIIGENGTSSSSTTIAGQHVMSFRTDGGGILKIQLMETIDPPDLVDPYPWGAGAALNLANHLIDTNDPTGFVIGRDNTFPFIPYRSTTKINDTLRKKLLLNQ